ncbi:DMT family transporter [bacterium]|jgi:drug/metabolite transporter (DMT)-like permease|nr:DMT family transporter [bacterium]
MGHRSPLNRPTLLYQKGRGYCIVRRMQTFDWIKLTSLAAIWGSSFIFMKILAPVIGVLPTACLRILISGVVLVSALQLFRVDLELRKNFRHYLVVGLVNAALPFFLYAFASIHAPSSLSVIMNSTTPLFGAIFSLLWLGDRMSAKKLIGFGLGTTGVALIALKGSSGTAHPTGLNLMTLIAALAGLTAAACYALASVYTKKFATGTKPFSMAGMSHLLGGLSLLPFALIEWSHHPFGREVFIGKIVISLLCLSLICSAAGFILFFHLVERVGPSRTLTVGYLIPAFGIVWSALFLGEPVGEEMVIGTILILSAVAVISSRTRTSDDPLKTLELEPIIERELAAEAAASIQNNESSLEGARVS